MVDIGLMVREWLLAQSGITSLLQVDVNGNPAIYVGNDLPEGFTPKNGTGVLVSRRGGTRSAEISDLIDPRVQIKVAADVDEPLNAWAAYTAIANVMHGATMVQLADGFILRCLETVQGQELTDPDTGWVYVNAYYSIMAHS